MKNSHSYSFGLKGENMASVYLKSIGYEVLEQRVRTPYGELDLVASKNDTMVFIEVKARKSIRNHKDCINKKQQIRNINAATHFLSDKNHLGDIRFDAVFVEKNGYLEHIENAWQADN